MILYIQGGEKILFQTEISRSARFGGETEMKKLIVATLLLFLFSIPVFINAAPMGADNPLYSEKGGYLNDWQTFRPPVFPLLSEPNYLAGVADNESKERKPGKPPLNKGRIAGEIAAGAGLGYGIAAAAYFTGGSDSDIAFTGAALGILLGCPVGVYLVGNSDNETGSFWATLGGNALGFLLLGTAAGGDDIPSAIQFLAALTLPVCATVFFNLTRRYKSPPESETGLINIREGRLSLAVPAVHIRQGRFDGFRQNPLDRKAFVQNIDLLRVDF